MKCLTKIFERGRWLPALLAALLSLGGAVTTAQAAVGQPAPASAVANGEILVRFQAGVSAATQSRVLSAAGCASMGEFSLVQGLTRARVGAGRSTSAVLARLNASRAVAYAEPNYVVTAAATIPNDPRFAELWGLDNTGQTGGTPDADIDAPEAWDIQTGTDVVVAVIDTGLDYNHEDIVGNVWSNPGEIPNNGIDDDNNGFIDDDKGWDFANNDNDPFDDNRHGTHVSGTIAAVGNNAIGVAGVNWSARIMPLKFLDANGAGTTADAISAIQYATMMGARISNNSWGGGAFSQALYDAIQAAGAAGQLFVAAAGNDGVNTDVTPSYPASYDLPNIVSVAATDDNDLLATFSNFGAVTVDLGAPGVDILSTVPPTTTGGFPPGRGGGGGTTVLYDTLSGTSMASPHVAGAAALLLAEDPSLDVTSLKNALLAAVDPIPALAGITVSGGRLNVFNAVSSLGISIDPNTAEVAIGATQQFSAAGGTAPYTWSVADTTVGSIDPATGLFTGLAAGTTTVSAMDANGDVGTSGTITVTAVAVTPANASITVGDTVQLTATGGTAPYTWSSSDTTVATVSASGLVTALAVGSVTITATDANGSSGTSSVTVSAAVPVVTVTPNTATLTVGDTQQFSAAGGTAPYTWTSSNPAVASIDATTGLLTALAPGSVTVTATDANGVSGTSGTITVNAAVHIVTVTPNTATVPVRTSLQFTATGGVGPYTWALSNPDAGTIDPATGLFTAGDEPATTTVLATDADGDVGESGTISVVRVRGGRGGGGRRGGMGR